MNGLCKVEENMFTGVELPSPDYRRCHTAARFAI